MALKIALNVTEFYSRITGRMLQILGVLSFPPDPFFYRPSGVDAQGCPLFLVLMITLGCSHLPNKETEDSFGLRFSKRASSFK